MIKLKLYRAKNGDNTKKFHDQFEFVKMLNNPYLEIRGVLPIAISMWQMNEKRSTDMLNTFPLYDYGLQDDLIPNPHIETVSKRKRVSFGSYARYTLIGLLAVQITKELFCRLAGWDIDPENIDILSHQNGLIFNLYQYRFFYQNYGNSGAFFCSQVYRKPTGAIATSNTTDARIRGFNGICCENNGFPVFYLFKKKDGEPLLNPAMTVATVGESSFNPVHHIYAKTENTLTTSNEVAVLHFISEYGRLKIPYSNEYTADGLPSGITMSVNQTTGIGPIPYKDDVNDQPKAFDMEVHEFENDDNIWIGYTAMTLNSNVSTLPYTPTQSDLNVLLRPYNPRALPGQWNIGFKKYDDWDTPAGITVDIKDYKIFTHPNTKSFDEYSNGTSFSLINFYLPNGMRMRKTKYTLLEFDVSFNIDRALIDPVDEFYTTSYFPTAGTGKYTLTVNDTSCNLKLNAGETNEGTNLSSPYLFMKSFAILGLCNMKVPEANTNNQDTGSRYYAISNVIINKFKISY